MKKLMLLLFSVALLSSCLDDEECDRDKPVNGGLVTPKLFATLPADNPMTGALSVYPCEEGSSIYYGNYNRNNELSPIHAFYITQNGSASTGNPTVKLPVGVYNMVYWA